MLLQSRWWAVGRIKLRTTALTSGALFRRGILAVLYIGQRRKGLQEHHVWLPCVPAQDSIDGE